MIIVYVCIGGGGGGLIGMFYFFKKLEFIRMYIWKLLKILILVCFRKKF